MSGHRVYIGHLSIDTSERDLKDLFKDFGKIRDVTIKNRFGFVEFDERRDAEDAVREFHGTKFMGQRIVVELAMGRKRTESRRDNGNSSNSSANRIIVRNLPSKTTWQDLKDFMGKAGRVTFADILKNRDGEGVVEFAKREDMKYALDKLKNERLHGHRLDLEETGRSRRRSSRDRSRSPRRSSRRSVSRSRSRSRSASGSRSRFSRRNEADDDNNNNMADNADSTSPVKVEEEIRETKRSRSESANSRSSLDSRD